MVRRTLQHCRPNGQQQRGAQEGIFFESRGRAAITSAVKTSLINAIQVPMDPIRNKKTYTAVRTRLLQKED